MLRQTVRMVNNCRVLHPQPYFFHFPHPPPRALPIQRWAANLQYCVWYLQGPCSATESRPTGCRDAYRGPCQTRRVAGCDSEQNLRGPWTRTRIPCRAGGQLHALQPCLDSYLAHRLPWKTRCAEHIGHLSKAGWAMGCAAGHRRKGRVKQATSVPVGGNLLGTVKRPFLSGNVVVAGEHLLVLVRVLMVGWLTGN